MEREEKVSKQDDGWRLSPSDRAEFLSMFLGRLVELMADEVRDNLVSTAKNGDVFEECFWRAYASKAEQQMMAAARSLEKYKTERGKLDLVAQIFGDQLNLKSNDIPLDVASRMNWLKQRKAQQFEKDVKNTIDRHEIQSPIEQLFLMQWHFLDTSSKQQLMLLPQAKIETDIGNFIVDFLVHPKHEPASKVAIEIDGHEFHERSKDQVAKDKRRERALAANNLRVLRFSGSEVYRDPGQCIDEVVQFFERIS